MKDFRKLFSVLAPVKVGIFHLPKYYSTSKIWFQNEETGQMTWINKVVDSSVPDNLIEDMKLELKINEYEPSSSVYLSARAKTREWSSWCGEWDPHPYLPVKY